MSTDAERWGAIEKQLEQHLSRLPARPAVLVWIPTARVAKDLVEDAGSPARLRRVLPHLARLTRGLPTGEGEEEDGRAWRRRLAPRLAWLLGGRVAEGDLLAALLLAAFRPVLEAEEVAITGSAEERMATDPLASLAHDLLAGSDGERDRALDRLAAERPLPLLFALLDLLCFVALDEPGGAVFDLRVRCRIALGLHAFGDDALRALVRRGGLRGELLYVAGALAGLLDGAALDSLLREAEPEDRLALAEALAVSQRADAFSRLLALLVFETDRLTCGLLAELIGRAQAGDEPVLPGETPDDRIVELVQARWMPAPARRALVRWGAPRPALLARLMQTEEPGARRVVFDGLVELLAGGAELQAPGLPDFLTAVVRAGPDVRAVEALLPLGQRPTWRGPVCNLLADLLTGAPPDVLIAVVEAASALGAKALVPDLRALAERVEGEVRAAALAVLSRLADSADLGKLIELAVDPDPAVRGRGVAALEGVGAAPVARLAQGLFGAADPESLVLALPVEQREAAGRLLAALLLSRERQPASAPLLAGLAAASWLAEPLGMALARAGGGAVASWLEAWFWRERDPELAAACLDLMHAVSPGLTAENLEAELLTRSTASLQRGELTVAALRRVLERGRAERLTLTQRRALAGALAIALAGRETRQRSLELWPLLADRLFPLVTFLLFGKKEVRRGLLAGLTPETVACSLAEPALADDPECVTGLCRLLCAAGEELEPLRPPLRRFVVSHPGQMVPRLVELALGTPEGLEALKRLAAVADREAAAQLIDAVVPRLEGRAGWRRTPAEHSLALLGALEAFPRPVLREPDIVLRLLQAVYQSSTHQSVWQRLLRSADVDVVEGLEALARGDPDPLRRATSRGVARGLVLWLLEHEPALAVPMLACLQRFVEGQEDLDGLSQILTAVMRHIDSDKEPVRRHAMEIAETVRGLLPATGGGAGPYRGGGAPMDLRAVDRALEQAADRQRVEQAQAELQSLRDRVAEIHRLRLQDLLDLLGELREQRVVWALPALATEYGGDHGLHDELYEEPFEQTLEVLADALEELGQDLACGRCFARLEPRQVKTGLLSRVRYRVCERCGTLDGLAVGIDELVLELCDADGEGDDVRVEGRQLVMRWRPGCDPGRVERLAVRSADPARLEALVAWWRARSAPGPAPTLGIEVTLDPRWRATLETL